MGQLSHPAYHLDEVLLRPTQAGGSDERVGAQPISRLTASCDGLVQLIEVDLPVVWCEWNSAVISEDELFESGTQEQCRQVGILCEHAGMHTAEGVQ